MSYTADSIRDLIRFERKRPIRRSLVTPVEFRGELWLQKTRVPWLSCGVVYVILCLAVLVELRLVTDTDRRTQAHG